MLHRLDRAVGRQAELASWPSAAATRCIVRCGRDRGLARDSVLQFGRLVRCGSGSHTGAVRRGQWLGDRNRRVRCNARQGLLRPAEAWSNATRVASCGRVQGAPVVTARAAGPVTRVWLVRRLCLVAARSNVDRDEGGIRMASRPETHPRRPSPCTRRRRNNWPSTTWRTSPRCSEASSPRCRTTASSSTPAARRCGTFRRWRGSRTTLLRRRRCTRACGGSRS